MALTIGADFLNQRRDIAQFLSGNLVFARRIGRFSDVERQFVLSTEQVRIGGRLGSFRPGPEFPVELGERGTAASLTEPQRPTRLSLRVGERPASTTPQEGDRQAEGISLAAEKVPVRINTEDRVSLFQSRTKKAAELNTIDLAAVLESARGQRAVRSATFLLNHAALIRFLNRDPKSLEALLEDPVQGQRQVEEAVVSRALERLDDSSPVDREFLEANPVAARFIALDVGKIAELLNDDPDLAASFANGRDALEELIRRRAAAQALANLGNPAGVSEEFLRENLGTTIFLLDNAQTAHRIGSDSARLASFLRGASLRDEAEEAQVVGRAAQLLREVPGITRAFLEDNPDFARLIVADDLSRDDGLTLARFLDVHPDLTSDAFTPASLLRSLQANQAVDKLGVDFSIALSFFEENPRLAFLVNASEEFASALEEDRGLLARFFPEEVVVSGPRFVTQALNAFLSGFVFRGEPGTSSVSVRV